ncbi:MAG: L-2-amino-thiazoline-4-carboxylic acid hydrolase [Acidobacteria bacterium]|nr:L-2-amino-thiazoline-4-carboxylic acid hydrolase [Acidobacteriota bacterium]
MEIDRRCCLRSLVIGAGLCAAPFGLAATDGERKGLEEEILAMLKREMRDRAGLFKALVKKYGPGVLESVRDYVESSTAERLRAADLPRRDLDAILELIWKPSSGTLDWEVEAKSPGELRIRVTRCLYADEMRRRDAADIGFAFYCAFDDGFCRGFNPDLSFRRTKTLMAGDDCCNHTYTLTPSEPRPSGSG